MGSPLWLKRWVALAGNVAAPSSSAESTAIRVIEIRNFFIPPELFECPSGLLSWPESRGERRQLLELYRVYLRTGINSDGTGTDHAGRRHADDQDDHEG